MIRLHASALPRVLACLGSTQHPPLARDHETDSAREGTAAHWVVEQALRDPHFLCPAAASNGVPIDDDMIAHVQAYVDTIPMTSELKTEFTCDWYATREIEIACRADGVWVETIKTDGLPQVVALHIRDFKYGFRVVEAEGNSQLLAGAIGAVRKLYGSYVFTDETVIDMGLYQPRPYHHKGPDRHWRVTFPQLIALHDVLVSQLAQLPSDALATGEHCEHCPGAVMGTCAAYLLAVNNAVDVATRGSPVELPLTAIGRDLITLERAAAVLKQRLDFAKDIAKRALQRDTAALPGWAIEPTYANRTWTIDDDALRKLTNADIYQKRKMITPAEAQRLGIAEETVKANTKRSLTGHKLVRMDADARARKALEVVPHETSEPKPTKPPRAKRVKKADTVEES